MGDFNHKGNFSNLPIKCGDRIVILVGVTPSEYCKVSFSPGYSFTPISVPIRGEYNAFGGIESVDRTPGIEVLEQYFNGADIENIINDIPIGNNDAEVCQKIKEQTPYIRDYYQDTEFELAYIMEHESIFDYLVSTASCKLKDFTYYTFPTVILKELGYSKKFVRRDNGHEIADWTHTELPPLSQYGDYIRCMVGNKCTTIRTIKDLYFYLGLLIPEKYNEDIYEAGFKYEVSLKDPEKIKDTITTYFNNSELPKSNIPKVIEECISDEDDLHFIYSYDFEHFLLYDKYSFSVKSLFNHGINHDDTNVFSDMVLGSFGHNDSHLDLKYMKDVCDLGRFLLALKKLQIPWGNTTYYTQTINYKQHIDFLNKCIKVASDKKAEYESSYNKDF